MTNPTKYVPVRLRQDQLTAMDELLTVLGGSRSEFVRMAVDERLKNLERFLAALSVQPTTPPAASPQTGGNGAATGSGDD